MSAAEARAPDSPSNASPSAPRRTPSRIRRLITWGGLALLLLLLFELVNVLLGSNFREVIPGRVYRCSQPTAERLERLVNKHGIRTVINLRGCGDPINWYLKEARATHRLNLSQEDLTLSAGQLPSIHEVRRLVEVLENCEYPVVIHCFRGIDRTGLASTFALLLLTDTAVSKAREQLSMRFGHLRLGKTAYVDEFFDLYEEWLQSRACSHSRERFRQWTLHEYVPGACLCRFETLSGDDETPRALKVQPNKPFSFRVRCHNDSIRPWTFSPDATAGFHLTWSMLNSKNHLVADDKSGLMHAVVQPKESIDLTVQLPALPAGRYLLQVDLREEKHCDFRHVGGEPLELIVEVR